MLVLTRKPKETIQIGDNITLTLVRVRGQMVRLGIEAPRDVRIVRGELQSADPPESMPELWGASEPESAQPQGRCVGHTPPSPGVAECAATMHRCSAALEASPQRVPSNSRALPPRTSLRALAARKLEQLNDCSVK